MPKRVPKKQKKKRLKRTVGKEELRHFKIILNPIPLTPAESKARMEQLYSLLFSPKKELDFSSKKRKNK